MSITEFHKDSQANGGQKSEHTPALDRNGKLVVARRLVIGL